MYKLYRSPEAYDEAHIYPVNHGSRRLHTHELTSKDVEPWDGVQRLCAQLIYFGVLACLQGDAEATYWIFEEVKTPLLVIKGRDGTRIKSKYHTSIIPLRMACDVTGLSQPQVRAMTSTLIGRLEEQEGGPQKLVVRELVQQYYHERVR